MATIKDKFKWAIPLTLQEIDDIWKKAILTVDTNVLLDLYRYHPKTRDSILQSIEIFKERLWLSHQAAIEFFRNRTAVISSSRKDFDSGKQVIENLSAEISKHIDKLVNQNRTISKDLVTNLKREISKVIKDTLDHENDASDKISYSEDTVIKKILELFDNCIGDDFPSEDIEKIREEAKNRLDKKIPPGYKDEDKDDDRKFGDFFLWEQILRKGEEEKKPIILITSERKEDWWEKISGETIGLRPELRKEAWDRLHEHILVCQTENFLSLSVKYQEQDRESEISEAIAEVKKLNIEKELEKIRKSIEKLKFPIIGNVNQSTEFFTEKTNIGYISCKINEPTRYFTVSGHLEPKLIDIPRVEAELIESPVSNIDFRIIANTGTKHDFNIHMKSKDSVFAPGVYTFKYHAYVDKEYIDNYLYDDLVTYCPECGGNYLLDKNECLECGYKAIRECQRCGNEITAYELEHAPLCSYCSYQVSKDD